LNHFYIRNEKGIAPWGCISGVDQLDVHGTNVIYNKSKNDEKDETPLEPNHTHFIFIDDGTKHQYGGEIKFRDQFEKAISGEAFSLKSNKDKPTSSQSQSSLDSIPVVLVVIEGDLNTIEKGFDIFTHI
jgi:transient receptor potential cation channel subfamily M protein 2